MKKILVIGAGFLQSFVIKKAKSMGYYTLAVDADSDAIGFKYADEFKIINIVDEKACLEYAKAQKIDGVLTAATDYGVLTSSYIAQEMGLPGLSYEIAKVIKNKYLTRKCLFENHIDDTGQAFEVSESTNIDELNISFPVIVKPCDGSGSRATSRVDEKKALKESCCSAINSSITHKAIIESFIEGEEYGAESLVINGEPHVLAIMKKWMTDPPYYAELGHAIPCGLPNELELRVKDCVYNAIKALGINCGSVNMDMLITKEGHIHIVDIGARMGGNLIGSHIIEKGTGIDYMAAMIQNAVGDNVDFTTKEHSAVATRLLAFKGGVAEKLPDFDNLEKEYQVEIRHHMNEGDVVREYHTNLDGCGYIIAVNDDVNEAAKTAEIVRKEIEKTLRK